MPKRKAKPLKAAPIERDFFDLNVPLPLLNLYYGITQRRIDDTDRPVPPRLYHYTTPAGLLGIVENNKLWATHINYLNDATELGYARALVEAALARYERATRLAEVKE